MTLNIKDLMRIIHKEKSNIAIFLEDGHFTLSIDENIDNFLYNPEAKRLSIPSSKIIDLELTEEEFIAKLYIQLVMVRQLHENLEGFKKRREFIQELSKTMTNFIGKSLFPGKDEASEEVVLEYTDKEIYRIYYIFDILTGVFLLQDVFPYFREDEFIISVISLWEREGILIKAQRQYHIEFIYGLLPYILLGEGVWPIPPKILDLYKRKRLGEDLDHFVRGLFSPVFGNSPKMEKRDLYLRGFFLDLYCGLWQEDLENFKKSSNKDYIEGKTEMMPKEKMLQKFEEENKDSSMEFMDPIPLEDLIRSMEGSPDSMEISMDNRRQILEELDKNALDGFHGINKETRNDFEEIKKDIQPLREEMREVWKTILGESLFEQREIESEQRRGNLDVEELIRVYPEVVESQNSGRMIPPIYERISPYYETTIAPERIEVSLIMDNSGSMDPIKIYYSRRALLAMLWSLKDFGEYLYRYRKELKKYCKLYTEVIYFGTEFEKILPLKSILGSWEREVEWMKILTTLDGTFGYTHDYKVLEYLDSSISPVEKKKIRNEKLLKIVFMITDGASIDPDMTKEAIDHLKSKGIYLFGFQIGELTKSELDRFQYIWNEGESEKKGIVLGNELERLPKELLKGFTKIMMGKVEHKSTP
ncbi:MAG: VWA domain-containing protein [Tissierellia bacterium]|nr:VWA domain-containing protein [Tissierellia bacterium]